MNLRSFCPTRAIEFFCGIDFSRPFETRHLAARNPAFKRRAIVRCSFGTVSEFHFEISSALMRSSQKFPNRNGVANMEVFNTTPRIPNPEGMSRQ